MKAIRELWDLTRDDPEPWWRVLLAALVLVAAVLLWTFAMAVAPMG